MAEWHGGKGSGQRARSPTVDRKRFSDNWDLAFSPTKDFSPKKEPIKPVEPVEPPIKDQDEENRDEI